MQQTLASQKKKVSISGHVLTAKVILSDVPKKFAQHEAIEECNQGNEMILITSSNADGSQVILNLQKYRQLYGPLPPAVRIKQINSTCVIIENPTITD